MRLVIPGNDLLATAKRSTVEEAVVQSAEALERQLEKRRSKTEERKITRKRIH